ncbi:MAG: flagellar hook-basal body protein [Telluria sp.]
MSNALVSAIDSMQHDLRRMDTVSQNIANMATPGYRRAIPATQPFGQALDAAAAADAPRAGVDLSTGALRQTGRALDLAIAGDAWFELATPEGPAYTRAGDFALDAQGRLVGQGGFPVQGLAGELLLAPTPATVDHAGRISQDGRTVGQLKLVRFADPKAVTKGAHGLLQAAGGVQAAQAEIRSGVLEASNVVPLREMVALMETTRHFEAAQRLYQGYDEMLGSAIQKLGQF